MANTGLTIPKFPDFIDILGTPWKIEVFKAYENTSFNREKADGFCNAGEHSIQLLDTTTSDLYKDESQQWHTDYMKEVLRHEIVHAFLYESGLGGCSIQVRGPWSKNEEMVDWFTNQGQKIYRAWEQCGCLRVVTPERYLEMKTRQKEEKKDDLRPFTLEHFSKMADNEIQMRIKNKILESLGIHDNLNEIPKDETTGKEQD